MGCHKARVARCCTQRRVSWAGGGHAGVAAARHRRRAESRAGCATGSLAAVASYYYCGIKQRWSSSLRWVLSRALRCRWVGVVGGVAQAKRMQCSGGLSSAGGSQWRLAETDDRARVVRSDGSTGPGRLRSDGGSPLSRPMQRARQARRAAPPIALVLRRAFHRCSNHSEALELSLNGTSILRDAQTNFAPLIAEPSALMTGHAPASCVFPQGFHSFEKPSSAPQEP